MRIVGLLGLKWSFIANALPGRTDDAVRNRYLRTWFTLDLVSGLPIDAVTFFMGLDGDGGFEGGEWQVTKGARVLRTTRVMRMMRLLKLLRMLRLHEVSSQVQHWVSFDPLRQARCGLTRSSNPPAKPEWIHPPSHTVP